MSVIIADLKCAETMFLIQFAMKEDVEICRLLELMPASGLMMIQIVSKPHQFPVIETPFPKPWMKKRLIFINFHLWQSLPQPQRDLLLLRSVSRLCYLQWFKPDWNQGLVVAGGLGMLVEWVQNQPFGLLVAGGACAWGVQRFWKSNYPLQLELETDALAISIAQRRGYPASEAARHLLTAIEAVVKLEKRTALNPTEIIRCRQLGRRN